MKIFFSWKRAESTRSHAVGVSGIRSAARAWLSAAFALPLIAIVLSPVRVMAQNTPCDFNGATMQFKGTAAEQARCLLRPNRTGGVLGPRLAALPAPLEKLVGAEVKIKKSALRRYLAELSIAEEAVGGSLDEPLSTATLPGGETVQALYFVIHDTSWPYLQDAPFSADFESDAGWRGNNLDIWLKNPVAHVFVSRLGESVTTTSFAKAVGKGWGTKFAREYLREEGKGMQIHIELVQPRRRDPRHPNPLNDLVAPVPGFTGPQYERLALLYAAASIRRGTWLIPAYHAAVDAGIKNAHDDPQNFQLDEFARKLEQLLEKLK